MSAVTAAGVEPIRCDAPGCDWCVVECPFPSAKEHRFNLDALVGHQLREHPASYIGTPNLDDVMSIECPFKEESMRAAFYVGWLAARQ